MENIQVSALRFVYDFICSDDELLKKNYLPILHIRRITTMAIEVFKILHGSCPLVLSYLVQ